MVAAGTGSRMGGDPKQFRPLDGRPVMCWAVRVLGRALAGPIVVVVPQDRIGEGEQLVRAHLVEAVDRIHVVGGGARRRDSVAAGLDGLDDAATVLVHDAVRPFASRGLVERVARRAHGGRVVVPGVHPRDTIKTVKGDRVVGTLDRETLLEVQTPQGFPRSVLAEAHAETDADATDDAALCERAGAVVTWTHGERMNRKLTDPEDWAWAESAVAAGRVRWW